jgi:hypothetical protein
MAEYSENNEVISDEERELADEKLREEERQKRDMLESLALSIESKFQTRAAKRAPKENQWLRGASLYYGKLAVDAYYRNRETPFEGGIYTSRPDVNVVRSKCSIAIAQSVSMQFGTSNKNWDLLPSKNSDDPNNSVSCSLMSDEIETQLDQCKYSLACRRAMWDRVVLGTAVLKGPNSVGKLVRSYEKLPGTETWTPSVSVDYAPQIVRVNPWFFYPDDTVEDVGKLNDTIESHPMTALELKKYMKHEGFMAESIERVLEKKPQEYRDQNWAEFAKLSENNSELYKNKYLVLEYHGPITRTQLDKMEIEPCYDSVNDEYYGEVWVCQGEVIRIELESIEASFSVPYYTSVWEKDPASVFGYGVPLMMEDAQRVVNESWHMILDNSAISSGPQVAMLKHLIEPANGKWELAPRAVWYLTDPQATIDQAMQFFNVPNVTQQIVPIMQMAQGFAEEESGIPLIAAGLNSPEVQDTATGSLIMHHSSTTLLDFMSEEWDDNITGPIISNMYAWNMQNNPKSEIKGAYTVDVRTSTEYKNKQLHIRDLEKISVECGNNENLAKWINQDELQRMRLEMMNLPSKAVIKSAEQVKAEEEEKAANAGPPPEIMELQLKARQIAVDEKKLEFDIKQGQQQALWDHEEKMTANQARLVESQARVAVSQNEKETEILKLAQKDSEASARILSQERIARENNQTAAFLKGLEETRKQQENELYDKELRIKEKTGSGI